MLSKLAPKEVENLKSAVINEIKAAVKISLQRT